MNQDDGFVALDIVDGKQTISFVYVDISMNLDFEDAFHTQLTQAKLQNISSQRKCRFKKTKVKLRDTFKKENAKHNKAKLKRNFAKG